MHEHVFTTARAERHRAELTADAQCPREGRWEDLTAREEEVVDLLSAGMTARTIARTLGISQATVNKHLENSYRKLGHHDRLLVAVEHERRRL